MIRRTWRVLFSAAVLCTMPAALRAAGTDFSFTFGSGAAAGGATAVKADTLYTAERGFGIEANINVPAPGIQPMPATAPAITAGDRALVGEKMLLFSVKVPEGNYRVTVTLSLSLSVTTTLTTYVPLSSGVKVKLAALSVAPLRLYVWPSFSTVQR